MWAKIKQIIFLGFAKTVLDSLNPGRDLKCPGFYYISAFFQVVDSY